jgi:hypothetical protein
MRKSAFLVILVATLGITAILISACVMDQEVGYLEGTVTIGPICPVERPGEVCKPPPEAFAARPVQVYEAGSMKFVKTVGLDADGEYRTTLAPGTYVVEITRAGIDRTEDVPKTITLRSGETVVVDIAIDTGIR